MTRRLIQDHKGGLCQDLHYPLLAKNPQRHGTSNKAFETKLNIYLSRIFNQELGLQSISETRQGEGRPDILIYVGGLKILIEGSYSKQDAEHDVKSKIDRGFADVGIALHYKQAIPDTVETEVIEQLRKSKFDIRIFTPKILSNTLIPYIEEKERISIAESKWEEYAIVDLASLIKNSIYEVLIKEEFVTKTIQEIELATNDFVNRIKSIDKNQRISENLYDIFYKLYGLHVGDYKQISDLIYAKGFLTLLLSIAFYQSVQPTLNLTNLTNLTRKLGDKDGLGKAFLNILDIDYRPIYEMALQVVESLPNSVLNPVIELGSKLGSDQTLLKRDFSGLIYHKIVGDWSIRKGFATFFTTIPASYLLAYLSVFSEFQNFKGADKVKICDFTCGSGTLLTAGYAALEDLFVLEKFESEDVDLQYFHRTILEENLWGFDALRYAIQIASLNLVFHNPSLPLKNMNFFSTPLGMDKKNNIALGSLKYLKRGTLVDYFSIEDIATKTTSIDTESEIKEPPLFNFIIMNPPFTRAVGRGGKEGGGLFGFIVDKQIREKVSSEYNRLREDVKQSLIKIGSKHLKNFNYEGINFTSIGPAGEGLLFLYLASQRLEDGGTISFVLPKSFLSGVSWFLARTLLAEQFHIEYFIVSYDKDNGYNFSESTELSEILIVARKTKHSQEHTKFVMLLRKPLTSLESKALAKAIVMNDHIAQAGDATSYQYLVSKKELEENIDNWGRFVSLPNIKLLRFIENLNGGSLFGKNIPITRLGKIATLGVDRHQYHDGFTLTSKKTPMSYPILFGGEEEQRSYMLGKCNAYAEANNEKAEELFEQKSGYLLVPNRIWLGTTHIISTIVPEKTLSNIFYAVKINDYEGIEKYRKALCVWLNSTFGILLILANREETRSAWISLMLSHWRLQTVLDITNLNKNTIEKLSKIFDKFCKKEMDRLPQQYNPQNIDDTRIAFDKEVLKALGIKVTDEKLKELYQMLYESFDQWFEIGKTTKIVEKPLVKF